MRSVLLNVGHAVNIAEDGCVRVPRTQFVATLQLLLQGRRLQIASRLPLAYTLVCEMQSFRATITPAGAGSELAWREREHDDLVLAVALATWHGEGSTFDDAEPIVLDGPSWGPAWRRW